ncbi:hypothetical protein MY4824_001259 [Beauveria thailandica]
MQEANVHRASSGKVMVQAQTRIYDAVGHATNVRIQEAPNFIFLVSSPQPDTINAACPPVTTRTTITTTTINTTTINTTIHPNGRVETKVTKEVAAPAPAPAAAADSASASASRRTLRRAERRRRQKQGVRQRQQQQQKQEQEQPEVVVKEEEEDLGITSCRSLNPLNSAVVGRSDAKTKIVTDTLARGTISQEQYIHH